MMAYTFIGSYISKQLALYHKKGYNYVKRLLLMLCSLLMRCRSRWVLSTAVCKEIKACAKQWISVQGDF